MKPIKRKDGWDLCTVQRTMEVGHGTLGGPITRTEVVTEPCATPLFGSDEKSRGVCRSCASGWEAGKNTFASAEEKARATTQK